MGFFEKVTIERIQAQNAQKTYRMCGFCQFFLEFFDVRGQLGTLDSRGAQI